MEKFKGRGGKKKPETLLQEQIIKQLRYKGWFVKSTHGNMYQSGFPDLYCTHRVYGHRWVEVKMPTRTGDVFTPAQHEIFPLLCANGAGVWVLVADTEQEYEKLFKRFNWYLYLEAFKS
jgi:hypothetical protein